VWEVLRGQMWLGDEPLLAKMQRRLGAKRSSGDVSPAQREPARPNCLQKLPGHLIFRAMRCSITSARGRAVVRFICCAGWCTNRSSRWRGVPEYPPHGHHKFGPRRKAPDRKSPCRSCWITIT
jgi:hypothetical protein